MYSFNKTLDSHFCCAAAQTLALLVLLSCSTVQAKSERCALVNINDEMNRCWYGGLGMNVSHLDPEAIDNGFFSADDKVSDTGFEVLAGYRFSDHGFAELKYADLGQGDLTHNNQLILDEVSDPGVEYQVPSLMAGYLLRGAEDGFDVYISAGLGLITNSATGNRIEGGDTEAFDYDDQTSLQLIFALGAQYDFVDSPWFLRAQLTDYDRDALSFSLNVNRYIGGSKTREVKRKPKPIALPISVPVVEPVVEPSIEPLVKAEPVPAPIVVKPAPVKPSCEAFSAAGDLVVFETNSAALTPVSQKELTNFAREMKAHTGTRVRIEAHTDSRGADDYNQKLSDRRAASVMQFLVSKGVNPTTLSSSGYGESRPIGDNSTAEGRQSNRRVEFTVLDDGCD